FPDLAKTEGSRSPYQRRWDCLKYVMDSNRRHEKPCWYLLLTLACNHTTKPGRSYLMSQLNELVEITGIRKDRAEWKDHRLIQEVGPKIIAEEALARDYVPAPAA